MEHIVVGTIYKIQNLIDGKIYIGQTINAIEKRMYLHQYKKSRCLYLKNAINKYGIDNFKISEEETIRRNTKKELFDALDEAEIKLIEKYKSMFPNGYNLTSGGRRSRMSEDSIKRRSDKLKKPIVCNETGKIYLSATDAAIEFGVKKEFIHRVLRGKRDHFKGMSFSYCDPDKSKPVKKRIKKVRKLETYVLTGLSDEREKSKRPIRCNETGQEWKSIQEAADSFGTKNESIHRVLRGVRKTFKKMTLSYLPRQS